MGTGRDDVIDVDGPAHSTGWVARRFGVAPATLRTWDRRYGIGPTGRTGGGHRRYVRQDLDRLERMRLLLLAGAPTAEAARASAGPGSEPPIAVNSASRRTGGRAVTSRRTRTQARGLVDAAMGLDQPVVERVLADALRVRGVTPTWTELIVPVLAEVGERWARGNGWIAVEHLFTECVRTALSAVITRQRRWDRYPPALLACLDQEQHSLALHALGAALAETGCRCLILGPSVPIAALVSAAQQIRPRAVFVWAQTPATARPDDLLALPPRRPSTPTVVGGPGWQEQVLPSSVTLVGSLDAAVAAVSRSLVVSVS